MGRARDRAAQKQRTGRHRAIASSRVAGDVRANRGAREGLDFRVFSHAIRTPRSAASGDSSEGAHSAT